MKRRISIHRNRFAGLAQMRGLKDSLAASESGLRCSTPLGLPESDKGGYRRYGLSRRSDSRTGVARVSFGTEALLRTFRCSRSRVARSAYRGAGASEPWGSIRAEF